MRALLTTAAAATMLIAAAAPAAAATPGGSGVFKAYEPGANAVTYDAEKVPVGSRATVVPLATPKGTVIVFLVHGLVPNRHYGAHVHTKPCGASPADSGPHFQNLADPVQPSVDPAYANPRNEVWLDFATNDKGAAVAVSKVDWRFAGRPANAVVIHNEHTHTDPGQAGQAGPRLACLNATF